MDRTYFSARWACATEGRYTGNLSGPDYADTRGVMRTFGGSWTGAMTPTGIRGFLSFDSDAGQFVSETRPQQSRSLALLDHFTAKGAAGGATQMWDATHPDVGCAMQ